MSFQQLRSRGEERYLQSWWQYSVGKQHNKDKESLIQSYAKIREYKS